MKSVTFWDTTKTSSFIPSRTGDDIPESIFNTLLDLISKSKMLEQDDHDVR